MKKLLLSVVAMASLAFASSAVTYMRVHTSDGQIIKYDVDLVEYVDFDSTSAADAEQVEGVTVSGKVGSYTYVDLGLPSGTLWATCNVGASKPTEYGDYFAWGETSPKESYDWSTYKYMTEGKSSWKYITKYTTADGQTSGVWYDTDGNFIGDSLLTLLPEDDAATANWGENWRMPTHSEQVELIDGCDWEWTDDFNGSGVAGHIGTSLYNGNVVFLPAAGYRGSAYLYLAGYYGYYWSSSLDPYLSDGAYYLSFYDYFIDWVSLHRFGGQSVRAVVKN